MKPASTRPAPVKTMVAPNVSSSKCTGNQPPEAHAQAVTKPVLVTPTSEKSFNSNHSKKAEFYLGDLPEIKDLPEQLTRVDAPPSTTVTVSLEPTPATTPAATVSKPLANPMDKAQFNVGSTAMTQESDAIGGPLRRNRKVLDFRAFRG